MAGNFNSTSDLGLLLPPGSESIFTAISSGMVGSFTDDIAAFEKGLLKTLASLTLIVATVAVSYWQRLGLEKDMVWSNVRAFVQLSLIGFVLNFIFNQEGWVGLLWIFGAFCLMVSGRNGTPCRSATRVDSDSILPLSLS